MEIKTKFNIGDKVRTPTIYHKTRAIQCPFCGGKRYVVDGDNKLECEMCTGGIYSYDIPEKVWGHRMDVVGAAIRWRIKCIDGNFHRVEEVQICVQDNIYDFQKVRTISEDKLISADEVEEGDPVDESYY